MDWRSKARAQRVLGRVPYGTHMNYVLQRFVTHTYPRRGAALDEVVATARRHHGNIERFGPRPASASTTLEFGAGWDLATPVAMAALGVERQLVLDLRRVARLSLVRGAVEDLSERGLLTAPAVPAGGATLSSYLDPLGIEYQAPADARHTGLPDGSVDVALSTSTLEHIGVDDIRTILAELRRVLRADGVCSFAIDYHDHYASGDPSIHGLHFLRYPAPAWKRWNCALQFQNRLRHPDFLDLFDEGGFEVLDVEAVHDPSLPDHIELAAEFRHYTDAELRTTDGWFVLRPR
ncbi:MAG: class I SAM-dependent methyltransferase [Actinomycetota bacterium]|nr:methyltransferase domain-containing protein [Acidimicrobiia bacterium]MDQ3293970.1 class I SAM-dependent methyltransferase [Actinomycetota bacterium]